ncbi:Hypothetical predicted protein [Octopus vulgaris]|uniref:ILCR1 Ig-like domain-containing protein n=1 Tax=Octopus vulgaris TaxID=6645 RepID=A0AA36FD46_OCTVU|nr:Hypothetical predicted protein [Octopus vulgaris]
MSQETTTPINEWRPCIFLQVEPDESTVRTIFTHAPAELNISNYYISLAPDDSKGEQQNDTTNKTSYNFIGVIPAKYYVMIKPQGDLKRTYTSIINVNKTHNSMFRLRGKYCSDSMPMPFQDKEKKQSNNLPVILSAILFLVVFSIISWFVVKYRRNCIYRKKTKLDNGSQPELKEKDKIKVYVINTFDHEQHQRACDSFMVYLHEHCFCEVLNLNENKKITTDFADIFKSVNFIILIHSEGYSKQATAWKEKILYPELCKSNPSILLQIMNDTVTNCIDCAMNYTNPNYLAPKNKSKQFFIIPDNMTELVCYIHNIKLDSTDEENIPLIEEHIYSSDDGLAMTNAIDRATEYELLHDDWFLKLHPHPFTISNSLFSSDNFRYSDTSQYF